MKSLSQDYLFCWSAAPCPHQLVSGAKQNIYFQINMSVQTFGTDILVLILIKKLPPKSFLLSVTFSCSKSLRKLTLFFALPEKYCVTSS